MSETDAARSTFDEADELCTGPLSALLREGLREIPSPVVSEDFDERVLQSVRRQRPWWTIDWNREGMSLLLPAVTAAAACAATLAFALWTSGNGIVRILPSQMAQSAIQATLQAADSGSVTPAILLLRPSRTAAGAHASVPAPSSAPDLRSRAADRP